MDEGALRDYGDELAVVVVVRSAAADLDGVLGAVRAATARPARVVVVSTGPLALPDGAELLRLREDVGRPAAVNRAVAALPDTVGWVALVDPHVRPAAGALDALRDVAARHPRAGLLGPRLRDTADRVVASAGAVPATADLLCGRLPAANGAGPTGWLATTCVLVRRVAWDSVDGFDPRYLGAPGPVGMSDVDLGDRLGRSGWLVVHVPSVEAIVRPSDGHGILEPHGDGLRRYVRDRGPASVRALQALAARVRRA
ncbi:hypothetical protein [Pseudonocardia nigra]|uniref:hypothetical protein n=1 Tax=Pseudonocardia nigra TaxID=1921578 RepID=UPI001C5D8D46|nr:hypothetical protein [Pseudonocardia nigra]